MVHTEFTPFLYIQSTWYNIELKQKATYIVLNTSCMTQERKKLIVLHLFKSIFYTLMNRNT